MEKIDRKEFYITIDQEPRWVVIENGKFCDCCGEKCDCCSPDGYENY